MNQHFDEQFFTNLNTVLIPVALCLTLATTSTFFLQRLPLSHPVTVQQPFYESLHLGSTMSLATSNTTQGMKAIKKEVSTPLPDTLTGIYKGDQSFVSIFDGTLTSFVDQGHSYKSMFHLVSLGQDYALFNAQGQPMKMVLGKSGGLTRKEMVTQMVPDGTTRGASSYTIPHVTLSHYVNNIAEIWKNIAITPVIVNGSIEGFRVDAVANGSLFETLGIQKGDILRTVNNKSLHSYADAIASYESILRMTSLKITLSRNNQDKDLEYDITR